MTDDRPTALTAHKRRQSVRTAELRSSAPDCQSSVGGGSAFSGDREEKTKVISVSNRLALRPRGITWVEMSEIGRVRSRPPRSKKRRDMRQSEYWLDFDPYLKGRDRNLYSDHGTGFTSMEHADGVLNAIRGLHAQGMPLAEAVSQYRKNVDQRFQVLELAQRWMEEISEEEYDDAGEGLSPYTIRDYEGYIRNHWSWWKGRTIHDINYDCLSGWVQDMRTGKVSTLGTALGPPPRGIVYRTMAGPPGWGCSSPCWKELRM